MARWPEWFRKVGDTAAHPGALDAGKKLLGYLATRRETPGIETLARRITLDDGTTVEASFIGDQPRVIVYAPDGGETCELYVESGMLDLGPNIAGDAGERFNRGAPEFDDRPATLYFGDGVDCTPGEPGLNGKVRVNPAARQLTSECLPKEGRSVESRLRDPVKKQAQAVLPASCWSGLMQRYVQAVYGGTALDYRVDGKSLIVEDVTVGGIRACVGLVDVGGDLLFVFCDTTSVAAAPVRFKSECGKAVYRAWRALKRAPKQHRDKLLTVALSCAYPDLRKKVILLDGLNYEFTSPYGWAFSDVDPVAHAVASDSTHASLLKLEVKSGTAGKSAAIAEVERAELPPTYVSCGISSIDRSPIRLARQEEIYNGKFKVPQEGESFDHPVTCYYEKGELVVIRYSYITKGQLEGVQEGAKCYSVLNPPFGPLELTTDTRYAAGIVAPGYSFNTENRFGEAPLVAEVACGAYAVKGAEILWSTQRMERTLRALRTRDAYGEADSTVFVSPELFAYMTVDRGEFAGTKMYADVNQGEFGSTASGTWKLQVGEVCGVQFYGYYAACGSNCGPNTCTEQIPIYPSEFGITTAIVDGCSSTGNDFNHNFTVETSVNCESPCYQVEQHYFNGTAVLGPTVEVAIPHGDTTAIVAAHISRNGVLSDAAGVMNYRYRIPKRTCLAAGEGRCTGTATYSCDGTGFNFGSEHSPHSTTYDIDVGHIAEYTGLSNGPTGVQEDPNIEFINNARNILRTETRTLMSSASGVVIDSRSGAKDQFVGGQRESIDIYTGLSALSITDEAVVLSDQNPKYPVLYSLISTGISGEPTAVQSESGEASVEGFLFDMNCAGIMQRGWTYTFRRSHLGGATSWKQALEFGESVGMDREAAAGGYPIVSTPSFVGWA